MGVCQVRTIAFTARFNVLVLKFKNINHLWSTKYCTRKKLHLEWSGDLNRLVKVSLSPHLSRPYTGYMLMDDLNDLDLNT